MDIALSALVGVLYFARTLRVSAALASSLLCWASIAWPYVGVPLLYVALLSVSREAIERGKLNVRLLDDCAKLDSQYKELCDIHQDSISISLRFASRFKTPQPEEELIDTHETQS